jgi:sugar lactone lactonase YvrE
VYVVDFSNLRIQKFNNNMIFEGMWGKDVGGTGVDTCISGCLAGSVGAAAGQFAFPTGIALDDSNNVYVVDNENNRIQKFNSSMIFERMWGWDVDSAGGTGFEICTSACQIGVSGGGTGQFNYPFEIALDSSNNVYVVEIYNHRIEKFNSSGTFMAMWGRDVGGTGVDSCTSGCQVGSSGTGAGQFSYPYGLAINSTDNLYVGDSSNNRIQKFDSSMIFERMWGKNVGGTNVDICTSNCQAGIIGTGDGQFNYPTGIGTDSAGNVYVSDNANNRIQKFGVPYINTFTLDDASPDDGDLITDTIIFDALIPGTYVYTETVTSGWALDTITCTLISVSGIRSGGSFITDIRKGVLSVLLGSGENVDCTFNNYSPGSITIHKDAFPANGTDFDFTASSPLAPDFTTLPSYQDQWGTNGGGDGDFYSPVGIALDSNGNMYVADSKNNRIQKLDSVGTLIAMWGNDVGGTGVDSCTSGCQAGSVGTGAGQFNQPRGVAIDSVGNVYVVELSNHRTQKFNSNMIFERMWGKNVGGEGVNTCTINCQAGIIGTGEGQFSSPSALAIDRSNNVYVADYGNHRIQKFDSAGTLIVMWGWGVDDGTAIFQVCTSGCQAGTSGGGAGQFSGPLGLATDGANNVYVADTFNNRIQKLNSAGTFIIMWGKSVGGAGVDSCTSGCLAGNVGAGSGQFNAPARIATDSAGNVYVADYGNHRIQKFSPFASTFTLDDAFPDDTDSFTDTISYDALFPGTYVFTETVTSSWELVDITCGDGATVSVGVVAGTLSVTLAAGDDLTCTFTNEYRHILFFPLITSGIVAPPRDNYKPRSKLTLTAVPLL